MKRIFSKENEKKRLAFVLPVSAVLIPTVLSAVSALILLFAGTEEPVSVSTVILAIATLAGWGIYSFFSHRRAKTAELTVFQTAFWGAGILLYLIQLIADAAPAAAAADSAVLPFFLLALDLPVLSYTALISLFGITDAFAEAIFSLIPAAVFVLIGILHLKERRIGRNGGAEK